MPEKPKLCPKCKRATVIVADCGCAHCSACDWKIECVA